MVKMVNFMYVYFNTIKKHIANEMYNVRNFVRQITVISKTYFQK